MNKKQKEEQCQLFAAAFHEVVVPMLENVATKGDISELKDGVKDVQDRVGRIETKLDKIDDRLDRHGMAILGEEADENVAWKNALKRAEEEHALAPDNIFPSFNISVAAYHTGDYQRSVNTFEEVESKLPRRQLWYQIEPILAYQKLGNYDRVFEITQRILDGGNRAFSELYMIRGEIYLEKGEKDKARQEFEKAFLYNKNFESAQEALREVQ